MLFPHKFVRNLCFENCFSFNIIILHSNMSPSRHIYRPIIILYDIIEYYVASQLHFWLIISFLSYIINPQIGIYTFNPSTCIFLPLNINYKNKCQFSLFYAADRLHIALFYINSVIAFTVVLRQLYYYHIHNTTSQQVSCFYDILIKSVVYMIQNVSYYIAL